MDTKEVGTIIIETDKTFLKDEPDNLLYKEYGVRVIGKQNLETGERDRSDLKLIQLIDYNPKYDEAYLNNLIAKASPKFQGLDADQWLRKLEETITMNSVLLDTSFFIRLLNHQDRLHENARAYYKFFLEEGIEMIISTISID